MIVIMKSVFTFVTNKIVIISAMMPYDSFYVD